MKTKIYLFIYLFFAATLLSAQDLDKLDLKQLDSLCYTLMVQAQYAQAVPVAEKMIEKSKGIDSVQASGLEYLGTLYVYMGRYDLTESMYLKVLQLREKSLGKEHPDYIGMLSSLAAFYGGYTKDYERAEPLLLEAKSTFEKISKTEHPLYSQTVHSLASLYHIMGFHEKAEPLAIQALKIQEKTMGKENEVYALGLHDLAVLYAEMRQFEQAEMLYLEARDIREKVLGKEHPSYISSLNGLGRLYQDMGNYEKSEPFFVEAKATFIKTVGKNHPFYANILNNLAGLYQTIHRYDEAIPLFLETISLFEKSFGKEHPNYVIAINNLALVYIDMKDFKLAEKLLIEAKNIWSRIVGQKHPDYAHGLNSLAGLYRDMNLLDTAFAYCAAGINANKVQSGDMTDFTAVDQFEYSSDKQLMASLKTLLQIIQLQYDKSRNKEKLLQHYNITKAVMRLNERIKNSFTGESNKLKILHENSSLAQLGIKTALLLNEPIYDEEAFAFAEQNKSILLADAIKGNRALMLGDLPDSLALQEIALQEKIDLLKKKQAEAKDETDKKNLNAAFNQLNIEIETFKKSLKNKYPKYHALKYESITTNAKQIQSLLSQSASTTNKKTMLLEYFVADSVLYLFSITKEKINLFSLPIPKATLQKEIQALRDALSNYLFIVKDESNAYQRLTQSAHWFYKNILEIAIKDIPKIDNLIIISDGELGHLPFEVFLVEQAPQEKVAYAKLHYLVNDYNISYNYSATLFAEVMSKNGKQNKSSTNNQMFACAASYNPVDSNLVQLRQPHAYSLRASLLPLPAVQTEVKTLSETFQGKFLYGEAANEKFFKEHASGYGVIHLAMHGILNTRMPMLSSLAFTENKDSLEDNFLQAYEIAHLKLNADLVVLSACETGYGKFEQGEGVMSLARSFMYAGIPSLVVSLWQVNDHSTAVIMTSFYKHLADGMPKDEALRQAKLEYLKKAQGIAAHPAFWSAFIHLGDSRPIGVETRGIASTHVWAAAILALLAAGIVIGRRRSAK